MFFRYTLCFQFFCCPHSLRSWRCLDFFCTRAKKASAFIQSLKWLSYLCCKWQLHSLPFIHSFYFANMKWIANKQTMKYFVGKFKHWRRQTAAVRIKKKCINRNRQRNNGNREWVREREREQIKKNDGSSMINVMSHSRLVPIAGLLDAEHLTKRKKIEIENIHEWNYHVQCTMSFNTCCCIH